MQPYLKSWQMDLLKKLNGGYKPGEMTIISSARRTGKSYYNEFMTNWNEIHNITIKKIGQAVVDNSVWFSVQCNTEAAKWIRNQNKDFWYEHSNAKVFSVFDIHEKLYTLLQLRFSDE